jgi:hypothetical protein
LLSTETKTPQSLYVKLREPEQTRTAHRLLKHHFDALRSLSKRLQERLREQRAAHFYFEPVASEGSMYFAVTVLIALLVVAAVLVLEHRGDLDTLEREYGLWRSRFKDKKR